MKTLIPLGLVILSFVVCAISVSAQTGPIAAILLATVEAETDPDLRSEALEHAVESVSAAVLPAILDSLAHYASRAATEFRELLIRRWAESDAHAAAEWTLLLLEGPVYHGAVVQVALAWANRDLPAAAIWVQALPEGKSKQAATLGLAYEAARTEPVMALELGSTLPPSAERDDLLVHAVSQWVGDRSEPAIAWALRVPDLCLRQRLIAAVAVALAERDGAAAATLLVNGLVAGAEQDRAAISIVQRWAQNSPQAAASWVSRFPDSSSRDAAVQCLLALWIPQDTEAAANWLRELPIGSLREFGITAYAQSLADCKRTSGGVAPP